MPLLVKPQLYLQSWVGRFLGVGRALDGKMMVFAFSAHFIFSSLVLSGGYRRNDVYFDDPRETVDLS